MEDMTEEDFLKIGIASVGVRLRIKQCCRNHVKGKKNCALCI